MSTHIVRVGFDLQKDGFSFNGMVSTLEGLRLVVPYAADPAEIRFIREPSELPWVFRAISLCGPADAPSKIVNVWRTVTWNEKFPVTLPNNIPEALALEVQSLSDDEIVVRDTNLATQVNIGIRFKISVEDTTTGQWWSTPDPQIINEKQTGG